MATKNTTENKTTQKNTTKRTNKNMPKITDEMIKTPIFWILLVVALIAYFCLNKCADSTAKEDPKIDETPTYITSIEEISEWEFLTVQMEEMVDTTISKLFSTKQLTKIYSGTARLGIDSKKAPKNWINCHHDTADVKLPPIQLIDKEIIDDTQTRTFFEKGEMTAAVKERMFQIAKKKMKETAMSEENIQAAEANAIQHFKSMFIAMGYKVVNVSF